jgi:hypothetical protein
VSRKKGLYWLRETIPALRDNNLYTSAALSALLTSFARFQEKVEAGEGYEGEGCVKELCIFVLLLPSLT